MNQRVHNGIARLRNLGIGSRLALGFGLVCLLIVVMAVNAAWQASNLQSRFAHALSDGVPVLTRLQALSVDVSEVSLAARDSILATEPAAAQAALERIEAGRNRIGEAIEALNKQVGDDQKALAEELGNHSSSVLVVLVKLSRLHRAQQTDAAKALLFTQLQPKMDAFAKGIDKAQLAQLRALERSREQSNARTAMSRWVTAAMAAAALLISGVLAWLITRSITRPVGDTVRMAEAIAAGDLTATLAIRRDDELGRLQQAVLAMQQQLRELVGSICKLADQLAHASGEIADGSQDLSRRTEETAASLQQTAGAIDQLTATVRRSVDAARSANEMVSTAAGTAQRGGDAVSMIVQRMGEIAAASGKIGDITGVIDGIAFQTNILALNAAVEAARAGAHGKGFAVVAAEVRSLAQRAAQAAHEIKGLIHASTSTVQSGQQLVKDAGVTMRDIVSGVARATAMVDEICKAAGTQSQGLGDVNQSVTRLDEMTQQNAALVEQSAASAESLRDQARELQSLVNKFKLTA
jgi:methyl-accepting chemotaxis protein